MTIDPKRRRLRRRLRELGLSLEEFAALRAASPERTEEDILSVLWERHLMSEAGFSLVQADESEAQRDPYAKTPHTSKSVRPRSLRPFSEALAALGGPKMRRDPGPTKDAASFTVSYDGEVLRDGTMGVRELAPALLAVGQLCERANTVLNGDRAKVTVLVKADFKRGSVGVDLQLVQELLTGENITVAKELLALLGFTSISAVAAGLFKLIRRLRGKQPPEADEDGNVKIDIHGDGNLVILSPKLVALARDREVRAQAEDTLRPLRREGIDTFETIDAGEVVERVTEDEIKYFELEDEPEE